MNFWMQHLPWGRRRREWRAEEQQWRESESYPSRLVRVYRSERQMRREKRRLRKLGYAVRYSTMGRETKRSWYVTYERQST